MTLHSKQTAFQQPVLQQTVFQHTAFSNRHSATGIQQPAFSNRHSASCAPATGIQQTALSKQRSNNHYSTNGISFLGCGGIAKAAPTGLGSVGWRQHFIFGMRRDGQGAEINLKAIGIASRAQSV